MQTTITKNIALAGHAGSGKTTLCEALLYQSGVTERIGKITEGNTVSDYTAEEIKRKILRLYNTFHHSHRCLTGQSFGYTRNV